MSASDDERDDDARLKQLRSVWVSMREEEPSDRGMAALMAAARTKASELEQAAQPSWWQRIAASLRRPPVLALATVTVLLGGALIVTQRRDSMKSGSVVETETSTKGAQDNERGYEGEHAPGTGAASAGSASTVDVTIEIPTTVPTAEPALAADPAATENVVHDDKQYRGGGSKTAKDKSTTNATVAIKPRPAGPTRERDDFAPPPEPSNADGATMKAPVTPAPHAGASSAPLAIAQDSDQAPVDEPVGGGKAASQPQPTKPSPKKPIARTPPPSIQGEDRVTADTAKAQAQQTTLDQLVKQCETAAAKGDCPAVRSLAQRIFSTSPAAYKTRVANKPAIVRCLPQAADNATSAE